MTQIYRLAKVTPPKVNDIVPRRRLLDLLESYRQKQTQLIMLIAEAGFGKTSLAANFTVGLEAKIAWCDLEDSDRNFAQFLNFLIFAVQQTLPIYNFEQESHDFAFLNQFRQTQANLGKDSVQPALVRKLADAFATDLIAFKESQLLAAEEDLWLVLDNYQFGQSQANNFFIEQLLRWQLPHFRMLILARTLPEDFPFAALSLDKRAEVIGPPQLRFERADTAAFLTTRYGAEIGPGIIDKIHTVTQGWAVALRLTMISLEQSGVLNQADLNINQAFANWLASLEKATHSSAGLMAAVGTTKTLPEASLEPFLNYLTTTFLAQQSADRQQFLLQTSLLDTLSLQNCQRLTKRSREDCHAHLAGLGNQSLILTRLDTDTELFQYHSLIRGFLQLLFKKRDPLNYRASCAEVAQLYEESGQYQLAVDNWLQASEPDEAVRVACAVIFKLFETGSYSAAIKNLLSKLPERALETKARLLHTRGILAQEAGSLAEAQEFLERAIDLYEDEAEIGLGLKAKSDLAFSLAVTDKYEQATSLAETVLEHYQPYKNEKPARKNPDLEWVIRAAANAQLALGSIGQRQRHYKQAEKGYQAAETLFLQIGDKGRATVSQGMLASVYRTRGRLLEAAITYRRILRDWERAGNLSQAIYIQHYLASIDRHSGRYAEALLQCEQNIVQINELQQFYLLPYAWYEMAECYTGQENYSQARVFYQKARNEIAGGKLISQEVDIVLGMALGSWLSLTDTAARSQQPVLELFEEAYFLIQQNKLTQKQLLYWLALSVTEIGRKMYHEAANNLTQALNLLEQYPDIVLQARLLFMNAIVSFRLGNKPTALENLAQSLQLSSSFSYYPYLPCEIKLAHGLLEYAAGWLSKAGSLNAGEWQNNLSLLLPKFLEYLNFSVPETATVAEPAPPRPSVATNPVTRQNGQNAKTGEAGTILIELKGLDGGKVFKNGVEITQWAWPKARWLLFYLMEKRAATAERIKEDFWPGTPPDKQNGKVYSLVSGLRETFEDKDIVFKKNGSYWLKTEIISYDVLQFEQAAKKLVPLKERANPTDLKIAADLYCQEYLENLDSLWAEERRPYLKELYIEVLHLLGKQMMSKRNYLEAVQIWQQLLAKDSYYDEAYLSLIETYKELGQETAARQTQKKYDDTLKTFNS